MLAAFVGGSFATGIIDAYSDLDLYAIVQPDVYASFLAGHRDFMAGLGEPIFLEHFDGFGFDKLVFIFVDGVQGERGLAKPDSFLHIHGREYKVLVDKIGLLQGVEFPLQRPDERQQLALLRKELL